MISIESAYRYRRSFLGEMYYVAVLEYGLDYWRPVMMTTYRIAASIKFTNTIEDSNPGSTVLLFEISYDDQYFNLASIQVPAPDMGPQPMRIVCTLDTDPGAPLCDWKPLGVGYGLDAHMLEDIIGLARVIIVAIDVSTISIDTILCPCSEFVDQQIILSGNRKAIETALSNASAQATLEYDRRWQRIRE